MSKTTSLRNGDFAEFAGKYSLPPHGDFNIRLVGDRVMCKFSGQEYFELFPAGADRFRTDGLSYAVFLRTTQREIHGMRWFENGDKEYVAQKTSSVPDDDGTRMVNADRSIYRVKLMGTGSPVVVLESTLGGALETWATIQTNLATHSTVLAYDRAGLGLSKPRSEPRDAKQIARELNQLLVKLRLPPPYLLVGYSAGGAYVRVFAGEHPENICGLVLVEPSQLRFEMWMKEHRPDDYRASYGDVTGSSAFRQHIASFDLALREAEEAVMPTVPVCIVTGAREDPGEAEKRRAWVAFHRNLAASIPKCRHIISNKSAHGIVSNEPELVSASIIDMISSIRLSAETTARDKRQ